MPGSGPVLEMMTSGSGEGWFLEMEERRIDLREGEVTLGRSRGCGVVLRDPSVSRGHALLSVRQGRVTLQDLRSSNGTYVNGKRLDKETVLEDGDRLVIGETELFLHREAEGANGPNGPQGEGASAASRRRSETGEVSLFCPACGLPIHGPAGGRCPGCGAELTGGRLPRLSEAVSLSEVLPAGEALAAGAAADSGERTSFRQRGTGPREVPPLPPISPIAPSPPAASSPPSPPISEPAVPVAGPETSSSTAETRPRDASSGVQLEALPMSVREVERRPSPPREVSAVRAPTPVPPSLLPPPGLWSRLAGYFRGRR